MHSSISFAPWQVAPVSAPARIAAAALAALAIDSVFTWPAFPRGFEGFALTMVLALLAIRVVRGFRKAVAGSILAFGSAHVIALFALFPLGHGRPSGSTQMLAALAVGAALSAIGVAMVVLDWFLGGRPHAPVIALSMPDRGSTAPVAAPARSR